MFRLIHLSDSHFAPLPPVPLRALFSKRLIGYLNWQMHRKGAMQNTAYEALAAHIAKQNFQHLALTGDLVNLALPEEFSRARAKLALLGAARAVSLVFGNHDAYVPGAFAAACAQFAPWIAADAPAETGLRGKAEAAFPYMRVRGPLALIGASSALASPPFFAYGHFGARQAEGLAAALRRARGQNLFRAVMIHHPPLRRAAPWQKKLWGISRFQNVLAEEGAELVLHGHTHVPSLSFLPARPSAANPEGKTAVLGAASAAQEFGGKKPPAGYNLLEIDKDSRGRWRCALRRFALADAENTIEQVELRQLFG